MLELPFFWIDAFTEKKFSGNPCAVVLNSESLSSGQMQMIAKEMNLSETAFVSASSIADFKARYFTPEEELPFAGHPTVAVVHALVEAGWVKSSTEKMKMNLELPAGIIPIEFSSGKAGTETTMWQLTPQFLRTYEREEICAIYGIADEDLREGVPIQTVSTGTPILMIPISHQAALKKVKYADKERYFKLKAKGDFRYAHHFCLQGATAKGKTFARSLSTPPSELEDPFTGSSTGCMAAYLWKYKLISDSRFVAEQGHWMGRPGSGIVERVGEPSRIESVKLTGTAVTIMRGMMNV